MTTVLTDLLKHAQKLNTRPADLARRADIPYAVAYKFLHGETRRPALETVEKIAAVFGFRLVLGAMLAHE